MNVSRLKELRENKDNTQQQLADILNVKRGTYASWECGNDMIPTRKVYIFANHYKKSIDYILNLTNKDEEIICKKQLNLSAIGKRLKKIRISKKLSQLKIANNIGINQSTWWAYENGKTLITISSLIELLKYTDYSIDWILGRTNTKYISK